jgi:hypothetical protein
MYSARRLNCQAHDATTAVIPSGILAKKRKIALDTHVFIGRQKDLDSRGIEPRTTPMLREYYTTKPQAQLIGWLWDIAY